MRSPAEAAQIYSFPPHPIWLPSYRGKEMHEDKPTPMENWSEARSWPLLIQRDVFPSTLPGDVPTGAVCLFRVFPPRQGSSVHTSFARSLYFLNLSGSGRRGTPGSGSRHLSWGTQSWSAFLSCFVIFGPRAAREPDTVGNTPLGFLIEL